MLAYLRILLKRLIYPHKYCSDAYVKYLRKIGCSIGEGTVFFNPETMSIDILKPSMLTIGSYCKITSGVTILTHDYSRSVLRRKYGEIIAEAGETVIGDNVFIGMNSMILMNTRVGDNVIIGAGSIVTKDIPDNVVVGGNPARVICTLDEYYEKRKKLSVDEAKNYARKIFEMKGRIPTIQELGPFFPLYLKRDEREIKKYDLNIKLSGDDSDAILYAFLNSTPQYNSYEGFLADCGLPVETGIKK